MRAIVASDDQTTATKLRHALVQLGHECLVGNVLAIAETERLLSTTDRHPDLVLFVLPDDDERCLKQLERFRESTPARIIAVGGDDDATRIISAVHAGADNYLVENQDLYQQLSSCLARLTAQRKTAVAKGRVTFVASAGGGCGASVIASNLAVLIARERETCALFDFDVRSGDQAQLLNLKPRHTLAELCHNINGCDGNMLEQSLTRHDSGVRLLAAPQQISEGRNVSTEGLRRIVRIARSVMDDIVIDVGSVSDGGDIELLQGADRILLVFRCDFPALWRIRRILEVWDDSNIGRHVVHVVTNSCGQSKRLPIARIQSALRRDVLLCLPDDQQVLNLCVDCGNPAVLETPKSPFAKSMAELGVQTGLLSADAKSRRNAQEALGQSLLSKLAMATRAVVKPLVARAPK